MNFPTVARVWWLSHPSVHCFHCYFFFLSFPSLTSHSNCAFWYAIDTTVYLLVKGAGLSWGGLSFLACKFSWRLSSNPRDLCVCLVAQSCPTLHDPIGRTVARQAPLSMEILQTRILEWVAMPSSRGSSQPKDQTNISYVSCIGKRVLYHNCQLGRPHPYRSSQNARLGSLCYIAASH